jgi:hypothetical protein
MNGLAGIPSHAYYRLNTNTLANPQDSRALGPSQVGGRKTRRLRRHRRRVQKSKVVKNKNKNAGGSRSRRRRHKKTKTSSYVNYAGRQIGRQSQRQSQRQRQRQRSQSGGFQSDTNLIVSSLGNLVEAGVSTLRGTDSGPSALPFSDEPYKRNL